MRIASLVPSATELLFALGLGDQVVAVTHECDFPPEAADLPQLTASVIPEGLPAAEIDRRVKAQTTEGKSLYTLDEELLRSIAARHDAIVTVEEGAIMGGAGSAVMEALQALGLVRPVLQLGLRDEFIEHGDPAKLLALQGLDAPGIEASVRQRWPL